MNAATARPAAWVPALALALGALAATADAGATTIIRDPHPPKYSVEIEPHLSINHSAFNDWGYWGFGPGVRFGIPIAGPAFIPKINDSVGISFGAELLRSYRRYCSGPTCDDLGYWGLFIPVALQWNFWLTDKWSVFAEPGLVVRTAFDGCSKVQGCGGSPVFFAGWGGARFHFNDRVALTMRVGFPTGFSIGVSFF